jgi:hypothetical protein
MSRARLGGMAKPMPCACAPLCGLAAASVGMPITCPEAFTSAPPLLPGLIGALVWIAPGNVVAGEPEVAGSVTARPVAKMLPPRCRGDGDGVKPGSCGGMAARALVRGIQAPGGERHLRALPPLDCWPPGGRQGEHDRDRTSHHPGAWSSSAARRPGGRVGYTKRTHTRPGTHPPEPLAAGESGVVLSESFAAFFKHPLEICLGVTRAVDQCFVSQACLLIEDVDLVSQGQMRIQAESP